MSRQRRSTEPKNCDCLRATHTHGTRAMYDTHRCGCPECATAKINYAADQRRGAHRRSNNTPTRAPAPTPAPVTATRQLVATFPKNRGHSPQRHPRNLPKEVAPRAEAQGVRLMSGDPRVRFDRTGAGVFVSVAIAAESTAPLDEVQRRAGELAWRHEQAHPQLARALTGTLEEVAG